MQKYIAFTHWGVRSKSRNQVRKFEATIEGEEDNWLFCFFGCHFLVGIWIDLREYYYFSYFTDQLGYVVYALRREE